MITASKVIINKSVKEVWNFFIDPENLIHWQEGFQRHEHLDGTPGTVGVKLRYHYLDKGIRIMLNIEITEADLYKKITGKMDSSIMEGSMETIFHELDVDETELQVSSNTQFKGLFWKNIGPLMNGEFKKRQEGDLIRFKQLVETGKPA